ncbi:MAG: guanylate kinase [Candidatus Omnitrophica bacterium]|nr:guanylate kinase [Candidatus Omnitrophota bacterium]
MNKKNTKKEKGKIFVLSGPSGSGKTTLHKRVLKNKKISKVLVKTISATTRAPRKGEKNGQDYLFLTEKEFLYRRKIGYFLEWKKVFDCYYGTPKKLVDGVLKKGKNVLLCIDVQGAKVVFRQNKEAVGIFLKTKNMSVLKKRLQERGAETSEDFCRRIQTAQKEMKEIKKYKYVVINDVLDVATKKIESILLDEINRETGGVNGVSTARKAFAQS